MDKRKLTVEQVDEPESVPAPPAPTVAQTADDVLVGEDGQPIDLEVLKATAKPPEEWTAEEVMATYGEELGWNRKPPNPAWVAELTRVVSRVDPVRARELRRLTTFLLGRPVATIWVPPRREGREPRPRRQARRTRAGATRDGPSSESDEPPPLARLDGFWATSVRMVEHLERRRAKAAAA